MRNSQPSQLFLFKTVIKKISLIASSPRKAFYNLFLKTDGLSFFIRKQSGCTGSKTLNEISWIFRNKEKAFNRYKQILKQKTNPNRKSNRIYNLVTKP